MKNEVIIKNENTNKKTSIKNSNDGMVNTFDELRGSTSNDAHGEYQETNRIATQYTRDVVNSENTNDDIKKEFLKNQENRDNLSFNAFQKQASLEKAKTFFIGFGKILTCLAPIALSLLDIYKYRMDRTSTNVSCR